ncbi:methylglyoxal reductase (NADPH-dependent) gre2 [Rhizophlyctis rosea]|nr:methylglyoxal reductase (NADPH-dependent) gre2 [Rhizophlyctis rosea]
MSEQRKALVTGVNGYIAAHIADQLLSQGYFVRGTARNPAKVQDYITHFNTKYGSGNFEVVQADLDDEHAFDDAVKGVDVVYHVASPVHFGGGDPFKNYINPAVKGTLSVLHAANTHGASTVKRVIVTSSAAAILDFAKLSSGQILTEDDWNNTSLEECKQKGENAGVAAAYLASKSEAEKAAWKFIEEKKPSFTLTTLLPVFVFGPLLLPPKTPSDVKASLTNIYKYINNTLTTIPARNPFTNFVDVRDVATAHIKAATLPIAEGKRYILSAGAITPAAVVKIIREKFPDLKVPSGGDESLEAREEVSGERAVKELGISLKGFEEVIVDTVQDLKVLV